MPNGGSVNQIEPSDLHTTSLGELSGLPSKRSAMHRDAAVVLGARDAPRVVLAGDQPPLPVARVAVGVIRRRAEHADRAGLLLPLHEPVVRDVAPQQVAAVAEPDRPFRPAHARRNALDLGAVDPIPGEGGIEDLDARIRDSAGSPAIARAQAGAAAAAASAPQVARKVRRCCAYALHAARLPRTPRSELRARVPAAALARTVTGNPAPTGARNPGSNRA